MCRILKMTLFQSPSVYFGLLTFLRLSVAKSKYRFYEGEVNKKDMAGEKMRTT